MEQEKKDRLQYMIDVMQACKDGKEIESKFKPGKKWFDTLNPAWDWDCFDYRIKSESSKSKYRPFENAKEIMEAIKEHGMYLMSKETGTNKMLIVEFNDFYVWCGASPIVKYISYYFKNNYTFADGTPFGKLIEK